MRWGLPTTGMEVHCLLPVIRKIRGSYCDWLVVLNMIGGSWDRIVSELLNIGYALHNIFKKLHKTECLSGAKKKLKYAVSTRKK